ncbi:MAG: sulfatase [Verrucomicrobiota bacterium]
MKKHILSLLVLAACIPPFASAESTRPNVLVFLVDDMGIMDTSVPFLTNKNGKPKTYPLNKFFRTPNMERLAAQGTRLNQFYAMSVCSPTRVSIMTGQTSARHHTTQFIKPESNNAGDHGAQEWQWVGITEESVTLPAVLGEAGYQTIHAGKAHFGPVGSFGEDPSNWGFDVNIAGCAFGAPGSYYGTEDFGHALEKRRIRAVPGLEKYHGQDIHLTEALTLELNDALTKAVQNDKPFFAYMSHYAVHSPFQVDTRFEKNYADQDLQKNLLAFATMIEGMDKSLGDILDHLDSLGVAENTLVFFLGDNGTDAPIGGVHEVACAEPLRGKKGTHYEGGMRVPFIAAWAKPAADNPLQQYIPVAEDALSPQVATVCDLFPTILAATNTDSPTIQIDGTDLLPVLADPSNPPAEREFLMHFPHSHRSSYFTAFRQGDWKLIHHYRLQEKDPWDQNELFNLAEDPFEENNLADSHPEKLREISRAMNNYLEDAGAQFPLADDGKTLLKPQ